MFPKLSMLFRLRYATINSLTLPNLIFNCESEMPNIASQRRTAIQAIKRLVTPHFIDSGYTTRIDETKSRFAEGNMRPVRIWAPKERGGEVKLRGAFKLKRFLAITEFGPMIDAYAGGMTWEDYRAFPLEDLMKLRAWAEKTFSKVEQKAA